MEHWLLNNSASHLHYSLKGKAKICGNLLCACFLTPIFLHLSTITFRKTFFLICFSYLLFESQWLSFHTHQWYNLSFVHKCQIGCFQSFLVPAPGRKENVKMKKSTTLLPSRYLGWSPLMDLEVLMNFYLESLSYIATNSCLHRPSFPLQYFLGMPFNYKALSGFDTVRALPPLFQGPKISTISLFLKK